MSSFYIVATSNSNAKWLSTDDSHILQTNISTVIRDENDSYFEILLDKGYRCDGLSVPKFFRWYLPSWDKDNSDYNLAGAIHDALYTVKGANLFTREECDDVFRGLLRDSGISRAKAGLADMAVGLFAGGDKHWGNDTWKNKDLIHVNEVDN